MEEKRSFAMPVVVVVLLVVTLSAAYAVAYFARGKMCSFSIGGPNGDRINPSEPRSQISELTRPWLKFYDGACAVMS